jgi:S-adenosylmethionine decarboxylase
MRTGVELAGATLVSVQDKKFEPSGVTVLMLLEESHFAIHTYPAHGYASLDCFTCGTAADPLKAVQWLVTALRPTYKQERILTRGRRGI